MSGEGVEEVEGGGAAPLLPLLPGILGLDVERMRVVVLTAFKETLTHVMRIVVQTKLRFGRL